MVFLSQITLINHEKEIKTKLKDEKGIFSYKSYDKGSFEIIVSYEDDTVLLVSTFE